MNRIPEEEAAQVYNCSLCGHISTSFQSLNDHVKRIHHKGDDNVKHM